jgi:hypothetical protein
LRGPAGEERSIVMKLNPIEDNHTIPCDDCDHHPAAFKLVAESFPEKTLYLCSDCEMELFWLIAAEHLQE